MNIKLTDKSFALQKAIAAGTLKLNRIPCSICRDSAVLPRLHFHGSDWGRCIKQVLFNCVTGYKIAETADKAQFLRDGHLHEASIVAALRAGGHSITGTADDGKDEFTFPVTIDTPSGQVTFHTVCHTDGIIDDDAVLECKAVKDHAWKNKFRKSLIPQTYYGQCQAYMLGKRKDRAYLTVKHRHTSEILPPFEIGFDKPYVQRRALELAAITFAIRTGRMVARPAEKASRYDSECMFCDYGHQCWPLKGKRKK